jgi:hypothetical protein
MDGDSPTLAEKTNRPYFDSHGLSLSNVPLGDYQVGLQVYTFTDETFTTIEQMLPADCGTPTACQFIILDTVQVE